MKTQQQLEEENAGLTRQRDALKEQMTKALEKMLEQQDLIESMRTRTEA